MATSVEPGLDFVVTATLMPRSAAFYRDVVGAEVLRTGEPTFLRVGNLWLSVNVGGGPTDDKPNVIATPPKHPNDLSFFLNLRVNDIKRFYERWRSRGATFITEKAAPVIEKALTVFAGQFCMTGSRLLVQRGVADKMRTLVKQRLGAVRVGPASDKGSDMGPLIDKANVARVNSMVDQAIAAGARVITRGGPFTSGPLSKGSFYAPTF